MQDKTEEHSGFVQSISVISHACTWRILAGERIVFLFNEEAFFVPPRFPHTLTNLKYMKTLAAGSRLLRHPASPEAPKSTT